MLTWVSCGSRSGSSHSSIALTAPSSKLRQLQAPSSKLLLQQPRLQLQARSCSTFLEL
jgi:hypothetical protein